MEMYSQNLDIKSWTFDTWIEQKFLLMRKSYLDFSFN